MKNIHIVPTTQASRLVKSKFSDTLLLADMASKRAEWKRFNIYITSNEEIKEGEWFYSPKLLDAQKLFDRRDWRKIILTTDQDLIKDGVQAIEDGFLEWFVKNPSCEFVEVKELLSNSGNAFYGYKIIIPKEEPKQEHNKYLSCCRSEEECHCKKEPKQETTLEEELLHHIKFCLECGNEAQAIRLIEKYGFVKQEEGYSEQDMKSSFQVGFNVGYNDEESPSYLTFEEWIKEYKKK
jgi:hypothetical protein